MKTDEMEFFKLEDCDVVHCGDRAISIDKANALLRERGKVAWGQMHSEDFGRFITREKRDKDEWPYIHTHKALIINLEWFEQDSAEKIAADLANFAEKYIRSDDKYPRNVIGVPWDLYDRAMRLKELK